MAHNASQADVANQAVRMFLQRCGGRYDEVRGKNVFSGSRDQQADILRFFRSKCCYCGSKLGEAGEEAHFDHLVAMNRRDAGLHSWGNVVCACAMCNRRKSRTNWKEFLDKGNGLGSGRDIQRRRKRIEAFIEANDYKPHTKDIQAAAEDLYREVSRVAKALVEIKVERHLGND